MRVELQKEERKYILNTKNKTNANYTYKTYIQFILKSLIDGNIITIL